MYGLPFYNFTSSLNPENFFASTILPYNYRKYILPIISGLEFELRTTSKDIFLENVSLQRYKPNENVQL